MLYKQLPLALVLLVLLAGCSHNPKSPAQKVGTSRVYADYKIWGEEGREAVTCMLQFHQENKDGPSLLLTEPSRVTLDGEVLVADSARLTGAFYEVQKPLATFAGPHTIVFTDAEGVTYEETFNWQPLQLLNNDNFSNRQGDWELQVQGAEPGEPVRVLLTDTAFATEDINNLQPVQNGALIIPQMAFEKIAPGPVTLTLYKEIERPLQNGTRAGGRIAITYSLARELELRK
jgi:hypothetical protein